MFFFFPNKKKSERQIDNGINYLLLFFLWCQQRATLPKNVLGSFRSAPSPFPGSLLTFFTIKSALLYSRILDSSTTITSLLRSNTESMRMDDRSSKRARQQREGGGGGGGGLPAGAENEFGAGFPRASLAGCHLEVKPSQTHLFVGMAIELKVSILNDEDVVQQTTQGINVSITGEDGRVRSRCA